MQNIIILSLSGIILVVIIAMFIITRNLYNQISDITKTLNLQYNLIMKIQSILKNKNATNAVAEHAEIIYQDLLQDLIPIMASIDIMPRTTSEHPLWRALGGIMDEYAKNPFVLEKLRRAIKLDSNISRNINHYLNRANLFLQHMASTDTDGILATTFTDGLLGQSLTFFAQAQALANTDK